MMRTSVDYDRLQISVYWTNGQQMRSNISMLLILLALMIQLIASCPSSCVVCSEEITLCQGLTYILAAPISTKALIVTDGNITSVEGFNLSFLLNATLLTLSGNGIVTIKDDAFLGLRTLKTLLLDKNQISSSSITYSTFHELQKLQVLVLSNNALSSIHGTWFKNMNDLIRLHLNGNQLTSITGDSFEMAKLGKLRSLDLSNNFISSIDKRAFQDLVQLVEIDLSRNRLALIFDTFSSLTQLRLLSLDQNQWNCTCQLHDLAAFLRKYVNSSRTLKNADNVTCKASENPEVVNLLELTEGNCKSSLKRPPGNIKDRRRNYGRDIVLVAVFSFLGGVGLTCLVLALFNRKLQHGKANEHTSENCCCRTLDDSQCGHEPRNYLTKGYCNCHLTRENEIKVMSVLGSGREMPLLQENSHQETVKAESKGTGLKMPLRSIQKENEPMKNDHFLCLNCRLLQSCPQESPWNIAVPNEEDVPPQKHFQRRIRSPDNVGQGEEDSQATQLKDHSKPNQGIKSDAFCRRCANGKLGNDVANELWQSLSQTKDANCLKSHRQRHLITDLSLAPNVIEESKEHCVRSALESHRSRRNDQCGLLERSKNISPQLHNFLICKYIDSDKYHNHPTENKQNPGRNFKSGKEQNATGSGGTGDGCMNEQEMPLATAAKRPYHPKSVSFYVPDLGTAKKGDVMSSSSNEVKSPKKSDPEEKDKERNPSPISEGENEFNERYKRKAKKQHSLMVKLNLHPFRKARVQPEERPPKENTEQSSSSQHGMLIETHQEWLHASTKEAIKRKRKRKPEFSVAAQKTSDSSKEVISSRPNVDKPLEENGNKAATCISCPSANNSAIKITEDTGSPASHLQTPNYINKSPSLSPNGTSRMTVSVIALSSDNGISQNAANDIPMISASSEALKEDAPETALLSFHQKSPQTTIKLQMTDGPSGANNMENCGTKRAAENSESNNELSRMFVPHMPTASQVLKEESVQTEEEHAHNKSIVKVSILSNISSVSSNPETGNIHLDRNVSFEMNNDGHMDNESDMYEAPIHQSDKGVREHKDSKMPPEPPLLSECKVGKEAEKSLIPCSPNETEISVLQPTLSPTSADDDKKLPLQMEQGRASFSNNNYPSLIFYKDKKPLSI